MDDISQTTFSDSFFMKNITVLIIFHQLFPNVTINRTPALAQIMDWHRTVDKPLSEPMMA